MWRKSTSWRADRAESSRPARSSHLSHQDEDRKGNVAERDHERKNRCEDSAPGIEFRMIEAEGVKHAPQAVIQMQTEREVGDDVDCADPPHLKSSDDVMVRIIGYEIRMELSELQMSEVIPDEEKDDDAAPSHRSRGVARFDIIAVVVRNRPRATVHQCQLRSGVTGQSR